MAGGPDGPPLPHCLRSQGVREGIEWMVKCVVRNVHRPPRQRDIT